MKTDMFFDAATMAAKAAHDLGIEHSAGMLIRDVSTGKTEGRPLTLEYPVDNLNILFGIRSNITVQDEEEFILDTETFPGMTVGKAMANDIEIAFYSTKRTGAIAIAVAVANYDNAELSEDGLCNFIKSVDHGL